MKSYRQVPRLSLADYHQVETRESFERELFAALSEYGFVVIKDHGIHASTFASAYQLAETFFKLPLAIKEKYEQGNGQRGYIAFGKESAKGNPHPDLKEYWHVGPELSPDSSYYDEYPKNVWPDELPEFRTFFLDLHARLEAVALDLLQALAASMSVSPHFFSELIREGNSVQRLIHYPALASFDTGSSIRAAAHADINLMTLLVGATDSGLELLDRDGTWLPVENQESDLVIDTGDMMARLTNNVLPATVHRVVNPKELGKPRYSIPFFVHPHNGAVLSCLPAYSNGERQFDDITAGDFLKQRLRENGF